MSVSHVPHWQKILDSLTKKAEEWNFLNGLSRKSELELAQKFLGHDILRSFLNEWLELCLKNSAKKSATRSVEFRRKGNVEFQRHHDSTSLLHYTDAIRFAPYESEEHALALANRSAVLFHMKEFKECISDAEMALSLPYPARLRYKLLVRQAQSFFQLQQWNECESTLLLASKSLFDESGCFEGAKKEILALQDELNKIKKNVVNKPEETPELSPPLLFEGLSLKLPHASAALEPRYTEKKGRHIVTNQIVTSGDVLFVEKPYSFVVLPDQTKTHCHHCCKTLLAPVPCRKCVDVLFCTVSCELASYAKYHQWECGGIALMSAVGVAHLGLRIVLCTGRPSKVLERAHAASNNIETSVGVHEDPYLAVYSLLPHLQDMTPEDIFQYTATAELLTLFLFHKTDYFKYGRVLSDDVNEKSDVVMGICSLLIRHVAQLVCNAHAIVKFDFEECSSNSSPHSGKVKTMIEKRIATAIYSSASMMNHSCDPNISSSFHNEVLVVKARHDIPKGGEVFNCYGPHFSRMQTAERRAALQAQYFFFCECSACVSDQEEPFDPIQERLWALRCNACGGPLLHNVHGREPAGSKSTRCESQSAHFMICDSCGSHQPISSQVCDAFSAQSFYKKGCEEMEDGRVQAALSNFIHCRVLRERALYRSNRDLTATYDMLSKCYATLGQYSQSIQFLKLTLPAIEEQFGSNSIEVANELQKLSDVILCDLRTMETAPSKEVLDNTTSVVERALSILSVHSGSWDEGWQDLNKKLQELKLMKEMASLQGGFDKTSLGI